jgi:hypothetical protein
MVMTPREGFKYGFLLRCAEEGLTAEEAEARAARGLEKQADDDGWKAIVGDAYSGLKSLATGVPGFITEHGPTVVGLGALGAAGAGGLTGYGLAKMQEGDVDPEEVQRAELIQAYQTQAELARRRALMEAAQAARPRPRSHHGI